MDDKNKTAIDTLAAYKITLAGGISGVQGQLSAIDVALTVLENGYQSDQGAIASAVAKGVSDGVDAAVSAATQPLNDQIVTLTQEISNLTLQLTPPPPPTPPASQEGDGQTVSGDDSLTPPAPQAPAE